MKKKELSSNELTKHIGKRKYIEPRCQLFYIEHPHLMTHSVSSSMDNDDVGKDPDDPWNTGQGD